MNDDLKQLKNDHHQFSKHQLDNISANANPFELFKDWMSVAIQQKESEANAFLLATCAEGQPSTRVVYLKDYWEEGFVFYTNYRSQKGKEIESNNKVAMSFFWRSMEQQIRIEGRAEKAPTKLSDAYFNSRPRESKIGAWASMQSEVLENRDMLEQRIQELNLQFPNEVPRPEHWGGYLIRPHFYEFWQGRANRLHDRICFEKQNEGWNVFKKNP